MKFPPPVGVKSGCAIVQSGPGMHGASMSAFQSAHGMVRGPKVGMGGGSNLGIIEAGRPWNR